MNRGNKMNRCRVPLKLIMAEAHARARARAHAHRRMHTHSLTHSLTSGYLCPERRLELVPLRQHAQPPVASGFESALRAPGNKGFVNVVQQHSVLIQHSTRTILHLGQPTHASGVTTRRDPLCTSSPWPCSFCSAGATGSVARQDAPLRACPTKTILQ